MANDTCTSSAVACRLALAFFFTGVHATVVAMLGMISNMHVLHADKMLFNIVVRRQGCITNSCSAHWIFEYFLFTTDTAIHAFFDRC